MQHLMIFETRKTCLISFNSTPKKRVTFCGYLCIYGKKTMAEWLMMF